MKLNKKDKNFLLSLSRQTLEKYFLDEKKPDVDEDSLPEKFRQKLATFITLTKNSELRGCIGQILPKFPLYKDVINNT
ncbi:MAG: hypothetical protein Athens101428_369, partial [Candidatus Berkelbacteria bacterium Athens1014_28]